MPVLQSSVSNFICSLSLLNDIMTGETFAASSKAFHFLHPTPNPEA